MSISSRGLSSVLFAGMILLSCARQQVPPEQRPTRPPASKGPVEVETFTAETTHRISVPGKVDRGAIVFSGTTEPISLSFTPGSVDFFGTPVDFAGKEDDFLATKFTGEVRVPAVRGPGSTAVRGVITGSGYVFPRTQVGSSAADGLRLGQGFSSGRLDLLQGQELLVKMTSLDWESPVMPELNGATVRLEVNKAIAEVDPVAGLLHIKMKGKVLAEPPRRVPPADAF